MSDNTLDSQTLAYIKPVSASCTLNFVPPLPDRTDKAVWKIEIFQNTGTVHIKWDLPKPYAFGSYPNEPKGVAITLFANGSVKETKRTLKRYDVWNTGFPWGTGWSAQLATYDEDTKQWMLQLRTEETKESI